MDANLYLALASRDSANLEPFSSSDLLQAITGRKNTSLHVAVQFGDMQCVQHIFNKCRGHIFNQCQELLRRANSSGDTVLHIAARTGLVEIVRFIIDSDANDLENRYERLTRMANEKNDTALHEAVRNESNDHFEIVELLTDNDRDFGYSANKAGETPVYLAVEAGRIDMVEKILNTCNSAACGGPDGRNALHAAILLDKIDICKLLLEKRPELIREKDKEGWTPLHCAACTGAIQIIEDITERCPDSWELLDNKGHNFLHVAVVRQQTRVVEYILKSDKLVKDLLNEPDCDGNTPLLLAVYYANNRINELLVLDRRVNKNAMNNENMMVGDIAREMFWKEGKISNILVMFRKEGKFNKNHILNHILRMFWMEVTIINILGSRAGRRTCTPRRQIIQRQIIQRQSGLKFGKKQITDEKGNDVRLLVATLILTVTFTAGITVPGGFKSDGPEAGTAILTRTTAFNVFVISNTIAMALSSAVVFEHFWAATKKAMQQSSLSRQGILDSFLFISVSVMIAFISGSYAVLSSSGGLAIASTVICSILVVYFLFQRILSQFQQ